MINDMPSPAVQQPREPGAKLVQVCASYNDLFGLDDDGQAYQYNFNTNAWTRLGPLRAQTQAGAPDGGRQQATTMLRGAGVKEGGKAR